MPTGLDPSRVESSREAAGEPPDPIQQLKNRSLLERAREYKYRFAQSTVFGLPVIALALWAKGLDPIHHERWAAVLQAILAGWVIYVNAGMIAEAFLLTRITADFVVTSLALAAYLWSAIATFHILVNGTFWYHPNLFVESVLLLMVWTGARWLKQSRAAQR